MAEIKRLKPGIVYNSGFTIGDDELATLAVCYERIYLPYLEQLAEGELYDRWGTLRSDDQIKRVYDELHAIDDWHRHQNSLFEEGVLIRLCHPRKQLILDRFGVPQNSEIFHNSQRELEAHWARERKHPELLRAPWKILPEEYAFHLHRHDIEYLPKIFIDSGKPTREVLTAIEAFAVFRYLLPRLNKMHSDDILELRRKVKDTREGFSMHLQTLSKGLDGMVKAGEKLEDLKGYAKNIVETELIPDYRQFRRQLGAAQAGKIKKVLDVTGKIMEIDAAPWTPKFWGQLLKALGLSFIETAADQKERLSNQNQAFEFMRKVEIAGDESS